MKKLNLKHHAGLVNLVIALVGIILVLLPFILTLDEICSTILISVGCSLVATAIATWLTSFYTINSSSIKEMIDEWKLQAIYPTKSKMNERSNEYLESAKNHIDIVAVGMSNFLNYKGPLLEKKIQQGVQIRIISCNHRGMLRQRERDEGRSSHKPDSIMSEEVEALAQWVQLQRKHGKINIRYLSTYPGFSYLRIDDHLFFGPNLPIYKSQANFAFEFYIGGKGGAYLSDYFESLWKNNDICSDELTWLD